MSTKKRASRKKEERPSVAAPMAQRNWILGAIPGLILGLTFLAFSNCILNDFAYDDTTQILSNNFIRDLRNMPKALVTETWYWRVQQDQDPNKQDKPSTPYYRPVFTIYLMILWKFFGAWAPGWHVFNIILHMLTVYLVFLMAQRVTKDVRVSAIASALFALHPLRSESVAWVSGVTDPLLAVFVVGSVYFYIRYRDEGKAKFLGLAFVLLVFAAFTKEPAVAVPIFIGAYELLIINQDKTLRERIKPALAYSACFLIVSAFYFVARYYALGFALNNSNFKFYPLYQVLLTIPLVIWKYIGLLLWPVDLSLFHATYMVKSPFEFRFLLPVAALIALAAVLWRVRGLIAARFAILWFAINLLPVLNLSAFGEDFLVQERYVYIPSIGFSIFVAMVVAKMPLEKWIPIRNRAVAQTAVVAVLVLLFAGKSFAQNTAWKDDMAIWSHGVEAAGDQMMSHYVFGHKLINVGEYFQASEQLEECLKLAPENLIVISNLASANVLVYQSQAAVNAATADRSRLDRALALCEKGLSKNPDSPPLWDTLGTIHTFETSLKNLDRAIACFQRGLSYNTGNAMINFHLGGTLAKNGDLENGIRFLHIALERDPAIVDAHKFLGYVYKARGQFKEAIDELSTYLKLQPNAADSSKVGKDIQDCRAVLQALSQPS